MKKLGIEVNIWKHFHNQTNKKSNMLLIFKFSGFFPSQDSLCQATLTLTLFALKTNQEFRFFQILCVHYFISFSYKGFCSLFFRKRPSFID
jgi:hypothetical protein